MIASFFRDSDTFARIPIIMAKEVCTLLLCVRTYILKYYVIECVTCVRPLVYKYLRQLSDNMIRDNKHNVAQIISSVSDPLEKGPSFDLDVLSLALKYICSSVLVLKLEGLTSLNQQLFLFLEWKAKVPKLSNCLVEMLSHVYIIALSSRRDSSLRTSTCWLSSTRTGSWRMRSWRECWGDRARALSIQKC